MKHIFGTYYHMFIQALIIELIYTKKDFINSCLLLMERLCLLFCSTAPKHSVSVFKTAFVGTSQCRSIL